MNPLTEATPLAALPAPLQPFSGGPFIGLSTVDGRHVAVVLLRPRPESLLTHGRAKLWATSAGGTLPSLAVAALVRSTAPDLAPALGYWTSEPSSQAGYAWVFGCRDKFEGYRYGAFQSGANAEYPAYAVLLIPLVGSGEADELPARVAALEAQLSMSLGQRVAALEESLRGKAA